MSDVTAPEDNNVNNKDIYDAGARGSCCCIVIFFAGLFIFATAYGAYPCGKNTTCYQYNTYSAKPLDYSRIYTYNETYTTSTPMCVFKVNICYCDLITYVGNNYSIAQSKMINPYTVVNNIYSYRDGRHRTCSLKPIEIHDKSGYTQNIVGIYIMIISSAFVFCFGVCMLCSRFSTIINDQIVIINNNVSQIENSKIDNNILSSKNDV